MSYPNAGAVNRSFFRRARCLLLPLLAFPLGCYTPLARTDASTYITDREEVRTVKERRGIARQIALYLPNRFMDAIDMFRAGISFGLSIGADIRLTRWAQLAAIAGTGTGVGWEGRFHSPIATNTSATAAIGPYRTASGEGETFPIRDWEVGISFLTSKVAVDFAEVADFLLGWFWIDFRHDDYGWSTQEDDAPPGENTQAVRAEPSSRMADGSEK